MLLQNLFVAAGLSLMLWVSPLSAAKPVPGVGTLTLYAPDAPGHIQPAACTAVLITADTVITQASCFDKVRHLMSRGKHAVEGLFKLSQNGAVFTAAMLDLDIYRDYPLVRCDMPEWADACAQARLFCSDRFNAAPMQRNACLFDSSFYARTFAEGGTVDLALVYLNRRIGAESAPIAEPIEEWPEQQQRFTVTLKDGGTAAAQVQRLMQDAISTAYEPGLRTASGIWLEDAAGNLGLAALPSRFENLPADTAVPVNYLLARIDSARTWIDISMNQACLQKRRLVCSLPTTLPNSAPQPVPVPLPCPPKHEPVPPAEPSPPPPAAPPQKPWPPHPNPSESSPQPPPPAPPGAPTLPGAHAPAGVHPISPSPFNGGGVNEAPAPPDGVPAEPSHADEVPPGIRNSHKAAQRALSCSQTGLSPWTATLWVCALRGLRRWRRASFARGVRSTRALPAPARPR